MGKSLTYAAAPHAYNLPPTRRTATPPLVSNETLAYVLFGLSVIWRNESSPQHSTSPPGLIPHENVDPTLIDSNAPGGGLPSPA